MPLPVPPIKTMTDFVVFAFVTIVVLMLMGTLATVIVLTVTTERDLSQIQGTLSDIVNTLIGALVGFIAGKGQGRSEVHDELGQLNTPPKA